MRLKIRRVEIAGVAANPIGGWGRQMARNLGDLELGFRVGLAWFCQTQDAEKLVAAVVDRSDAIV
jgi:hypothetical protein